MVLETGISVSCFQGQLDNFVTIRRHRRRRGVVSVSLNHALKNKYTYVRTGSDQIQLERDLNCQINEEKLSDR